MGLFNTLRESAGSQEKFVFLADDETITGFQAAARNISHSSAIGRMAEAALDAFVGRNTTTTAPEPIVQQTEPVVSSTLELQNAAAGLVSSATIGDATINKADSQIIYRGDSFRFNS